MAQLALVDACHAFMTTARSFMIITNEGEYNVALEALEQIMESSNDTLDAHLNPLIDMLSHAIEQYESQDDEVMAFMTEADGVPTDIALLRTLMIQHTLTGSDLPEIGGKAMVSRVLKASAP